MSQRCAGVELDEVFTTDMASTPVHVVKWGFLGESWPFFRPNFVNMEEYRTARHVDEVSPVQLLNTLQWAPILHAQSSCNQ